MAPDVPFGQEVIREVSKSFSDEDANNGGKVQVAKLFEVVPKPSKLDWRAKKNGCGAIDSDCPCEADEAI